MLIIPSTYKYPLPVLTSSGISVHSGLAYKSTTRYTSKAKPTRFLEHSGYQYKKEKKTKKKYAATHNNQSGASFHFITCIKKITADISLFVIGSTILH